MIMLKNLQIGIMENDVALLQKLLVLGSAIQVRSCLIVFMNCRFCRSFETENRRVVPLHPPTTRLAIFVVVVLIKDSLQDNDDDDDESLLVEPQMSQTDDAITNLVIVADDDKLDCVESKPPSYFSRTRSVLRIPIKRASNRKLGRRVVSIDESRC